MIRKTNKNQICQAGSKGVPNITEISDSGSKHTLGRKEGRTIRLNKQFYFTAYNAGISGSVAQESRG